MQIDSLEHSPPIPLTFFLSPYLTTSAQRKANLVNLAGESDQSPWGLPAPSSIENDHNGNGQVSMAIPFDLFIPSTPYLPNMSQVPNLASPRRPDFIPTGHEVWNRPTTRMQKIALAPAKRRSALRELPHLLGYTVGTAAIFGLYLVIPLIVLLNIVLPGTWNKPLIALGLLVPGEFAICFILAKTTPRNKKKRDALAKP